MRLLSVNIGKEQTIQAGKDSGKTCIFKNPTTIPVQITMDGLVGDSVTDKENHGGDDQAVYVYSSLDYMWWSEALGKELAPGTFGENLTISDLESATLQIGDRLRVGEVLLEVTSPRIPCVTLAARMEDPIFVKRFRQAERPGVYCRVIKTGIVRVDDPVNLERYQGDTLSALEMFHNYYNKDASEADLRRELAAPIAIRARRENEERLNKLLAKSQAT
ncbi:MAG: MOSC domain-containing protein [Chitinophagaceae bacterium]|nr:MOSC domain-containing protein [Anaerolineae bacterium]